jgi:hypothetical protein
MKNSLNKFGHSFRLKTKVFLGETKLDAGAKHEDIILPVSGSPQQTRRYLLLILGRCFVGHPLPLKVVARLDVTERTVRLLNAGSYRWRTS